MMLILGTCLLVVAVWGYTLHRKLGAMEGEIDSLEIKVTDAANLVTVLNSKVDQILDSQRRLETALAAVQSTRQPNSKLEPPPNLSEADLELLRSFFKLPKAIGVPDQYKFGDHVRSTDLKAMPEFVAEKISAELRGTRFLFDRNGRLVITAGPNNQVIVIVSG
jgi:hypothetical protein